LISLKVSDTFKPKLLVMVTISLGQTNNDGNNFILVLRERERERDEYGDLSHSKTFKATCVGIKCEWKSHVEKR